MFTQVPNDQVLLLRFMFDLSSKVIIFTKSPSHMRLICFYQSFRVFINMVKIVLHLEEEYVCSTNEVLNGKKLLL